MRWAVGSVVELNYHSPETIVSTIHPYYGNFLYLYLYRLEGSLLSTQAEFVGPCALGGRRVLSGRRMAW